LAREGALPQRDWHRRLPEQKEGSAPQTRVPARPAPAPLCSPSDRERTLPAPLARRARPQHATEREVKLDSATARPDPAAHQPTRPPPHATARLLFLFSATAVSRRKARPTGMVENGREKSSFRPSVFSYLFCILTYMESGRENPETGQKTG